MQETSTKPYFMRAIYEWCTDNGYTPYMAVKVQGGARVLWNLSAMARSY
jgi:stringent starvation protein B